MRSPAVINEVDVRLRGREYVDVKIGGAEGDRTPDLMTASHALSQLSYGPNRMGENDRCRLA